MSLQPRSTRANARLTAYFWQGDVIRSRSVGKHVLTSTVKVAPLPSRLTADCDREIGGQLKLDPGDVEALSLARALRRWPGSGQWIKAAHEWTHSLGLTDLLANGDMALMACRGARYHHDAEQYGGMAFCNLFLSEDKGLDLHFPFADRRIPLKRGTAVIFDTAQPHAVIKRGGARFNAADFGPERDCTQLFLTWELPIESALVARALGVDFDIDPATASRLTDEQVWMNDARVSVCPESGKLLWESRVG